MGGVFLLGCNFLSGILAVRKVGGRAKCKALSAWVTFFFVALVFGGGGANYGFLNLIVQIVAILLIALRVNDLVVIWWRISFFAKMVLASTLALPLIQVIPLPPLVWQVLPGSDLVQEALRLIGADGEWRPVAIDGHRTLLAATALVVPFTAMVAVLALPRRQLVWVPIAIFVGGYFSVGLGLLQIAGGNDILSWFARSDDSRLYGIFANRNSSGMFFVIAAICMITIPSKVGKCSIPRALVFGGTIMLMLATVLTQSRSSTLLLLFPASLMALRIFRDRASPSPMKFAKALGAFGVGVAGVVVIGLQSERLAQTWDRFDTAGEMRWAIWEDTVPAIEHYWPIGSGIGGFRDTIEVFESLESVTPLTSGRAHNEYLEVALEAGVLGLALIVAWWILCAILYRRALREGSQSERYLATAAMFTFVAIALQSAVDYPLRNLALMCVVASLFGMLIAIACPAKGPAKGSERV